MTMIEVFKTNVKDRDQANMLIAHIQNSFIDYTVNFDLEDCDKILRVKCTKGSIQSIRLVDILKHFGFYAEVLSDDVQQVLPIDEHQIATNQLF